MGGAVTALADDFSATFYNPAGLVDSGGSRISVGLQFTIPRLRVNGRSRIDEEVVGVVGGISIPIPFGGPLKDRLALGVSFYLPTESGRLVRIYLPRPTEPFFPLYENRTEHFAGSACLGVRIIDGISLGGGILLYPFDSPNRINRAEPGATGTFEVDAELQLLVRYAAHGGLTLTLGELHPTLEGWRLGLSFRGAIQQNFALPASIDVGFLPILLTLEGVNHYSPMEINLGIAWRVTERLTLAMEGTWSEWSAFPAPHFRSAVEGIHDLLPIVEDFAYDPPDPKFRDRITPRLGAEYEACRRDWGSATLRGGYFFSPSPVPSRQERTALMDGDKHVFSCGVGLEVRSVLGWAFKRPLFLDSHLQIHTLQERRIQQVDPREGGASCS